MIAYVSVQHHYSSKREKICRGLYTELFYALMLLSVANLKENIW